MSTPVSPGVIVPDTHGVDVEKLRHNWESSFQGFATLNEVRHLEGLAEQDGSFLVPEKFSADLVRWKRKGLDLMRDSFMPRLPATGTRSLRW